MRVVVVGAGPTGLGAAHRLRELGHEDFVVLEADERVGGLARSYVDALGATYDVGGHVMFSHYPYWTDLAARLLGPDRTSIARSAWIWQEGRHIPYPFQDHVGGLSARTAYECVSGLVAAQLARAGADGRSELPTDFAGWARAVFGEGIARHFMLPYNEKVWATPLELMSHGWIGERVALVDVDAVLRNVLLGETRTGWGPNSSFDYPLRGGTGDLFERLADGVRDRIRCGVDVRRVDVARRVVSTADGVQWPYDALLSTMPVDELVARTAGAPANVREAAGRLVSSGTHVVGVVVDRGSGGGERTWVYYPEPDVPFYRVTYLSHYSPHIAPRPGQAVLLTETSTSAHRPQDPATIVARVVEGLGRVRLVGRDERPLGTWHHYARKSYPVPTLDRDAALRVVQPWLRSYDVWSRGRFGAWRYEVGNMDHSVMQGVEFADAVLRSSPETVWQP